MKALRNRFAVVCVAAITSLLVGCGGSGGSGGSGTVIAAVVPAKVTVTLPPGYKPTGALTVSGGLFGSAPLTSGSASIKAWNNGSELVAVLDSSGNPVLLGWIGDGNSTITARTTADALTYFAIEGFGAPNENQAALITAISQQGGGTTVANDITSDLASGKNLGSSGVAFAADLKSLALSLVGGSEPAIVHALAPVSNASNPVERPATVSQISPDPSTPAGTQSGVTINAGKTNDTLVAINSFRRRVLLFVDRSDTFNGATPPVITPAPISVSETPIAPAVGGVNGGSVSGNLSGSVGSVSSAPIPLLAVPSNQFGATYDVIAVGPGTSNTQPATLSTSEVSDAQTFLRRTFFTDFFLPVMNRVCISNTLTQIQSNSSGAASIANLMDQAADAQSTGVDAFVTANFSNALPQMTAGDFLSANSAVLASIVGNSTTRLNVATYYSNFLQSVGQGFTPTQTSVAAVLSWMSIALQNVDVSNLPIALPQYQGVAQSQVYSMWSVTQSTGALVQLNPGTSSITTTVGSDSQTLTATVLFGQAGQPAGSKLTYDWSTTGAHGDLVFPGNTGTTSLKGSTLNTTTYFANLVNLTNSGSDTVTVTATLTPASGPPQVLGSATATVTVNGNSSGGGPTIPVYSLRSATGSPINVTGGCWYLRDLTQNNFIIKDPSTTTNPVLNEVFTWTTIQNGPSWLYFTNQPYPVHDSSYLQANSGDTVAVMFDCPTFAGPTSISIDQDAYLYSPTGQNLGIKIPKFTSVVGGSDGFFEGANFGQMADWLVERDIPLP